MGHKSLDLGDQLFHATEGAPANSLLGDDVKPDFHLVEPRGVSGSVMHMVARPGRQPASHSFMFVSGVVIHHQVDVQFWRHIGLDVFEEF